MTTARTVYECPACGSRMMFAGRCSASVHLPDRPERVPVPVVDARLTDDRIEAAKRALYETHCVLTDTQLERLARAALTCPAVGFIETGGTE